jgi:hypothetical protein
MGPSYDERTRVNPPRLSFKKSPLQGSLQISIQNGVLTIHGLILDSISHAAKNFSLENMEAVVLSFVGDLAARSQQGSYTCLSGLWQALVGFDSQEKDGPAIKQGFFDLISVLPSSKSCVRIRLKYSKMSERSKPSRKAQQ